MPDSTTAPAPKKASLGVIFLTLYLDLIGFSLFFPLFPAMLDYYLGREGRGGALGWLLGHFDTLARSWNIDQSATAVLFAGVIGSLYSLLQFLFAPIWGARSDRVGRRPVLRLTIAGTTASYAIWALSGSFLLFLLSRIVAGIASGNLSVATAAVSDITTRADRAKGMGLIGAAFGLGFITGPALGGLTAHWNLLDRWPGLAACGVNPFTVPALIAFALGLLNLLWVQRRFAETYTPGLAAASAERPRHPLRALLAIPAAHVRRVILINALFILGFSGLELTLGFLAAERLHYTPRELTLVFVYTGVVSVLTQGFLVRRLVPRLGEKHAGTLGLACACAGMAWLAFAHTPATVYASLGLASVGSGFCYAALSALLSLYVGEDEQGRLMGLFRALGSLTRAIGPVCAGVLYWRFGSTACYAAAAAVILAPLALALTLPTPRK
ncbi:MAG TPA: MFS transporter [Opitutaceae bacterium]|nr:MFS transporter [Opitutaceae bacterium]